MNIDSKDIVKIIEACGKYGVSQFSCGDLDITFNGFVKFAEKDYSNKVDPIFKNIVVDPKFTDQQNYEEMGNSVEDLVVTDPLAYEEALFKNELVPSETHMDGE